jgi:phosphate-selective porin OprO and OprP
LRTLNRATRSRIVLGLCGGLLSAAVASAQVGQAPDPSPGTTPEAPPATALTAAAPDYFFPDLAGGALVHDGERFRIKPIIAIVTDYTWFSQDLASLDQVGEQVDTFDLRAARFGLIVSSKGTREWAFTLTADRQEKRTRDDATWQFYDVKVDIPIGPVKLTLGKQKEPFSFEMVGLFPTLPQQERILSPFFVTRNIGVQVMGLLAGDRMTWAAGAFNDWLETDADFSRNASNYAARVTGLATVSPDNRNYLHLGLGLRRVGNDDGMMRFSGRPESNVAGKYIDTGSFPADHAAQLSLEAVWQGGPFLLHAEHIDAWVDAPERADPHFTGDYVTGSWVVTGESRSYVRSLGYAGAIKPTGRFGAVELVVRYAHLDFNDGSIEGGVLDRWGLGANLWASTQWKIGISYGDADLDKYGTRGNTKMLLVRLLWMY